jgi:hypothetical protein
MTYEELLADIASKNYRESRTPETPYAALRAVLEIHKPWTGETYEGTEQIGCSCVPELPAFLNPYPCATVQAIEKELA